MHPPRFSIVTMLLNSANGLLLAPFLFPNFINFSSHYKTKNRAITFSVVIKGQICPKRSSVPACRSHLTTKRCRADIGDASLGLDSCVYCTSYPASFSTANIAQIYHVSCLYSRQLLIRPLHGRQQHCFGNKSIQSVPTLAETSAIHTSAILC